MRPYRCHLSDISMQNPKINVIFIAGTDTGAGKTLITGLLGRYLMDRGQRVVTQKWVQTGRKALSGTDLAIHLKLMDRSAEDFGDSLPLMALYSFRSASSPHLAARLENRKINPAKIERSVKELSRRFDFVIIEGTGGLLVPLGGRTLLIDIVKNLRIPVLVVVKNSLGAINHALLSIEALKARKIPIIGIVFNNLSKEKKVILDDNRRIIEKISRVKVLGELPRSYNMKMLKKRFKAIGDKIGLQRLD